MDGVVATRISTGALVACALALTGCPDSDHTSRVDELMSAHQVDSGDKPPPPPPPKKEWTEMPSITVDNLGTYIGGERASLDDKKNGPAKLEDIVSRLPIKGEPVTVVAQKKAKIGHVTQTVWALAKGGAPSIIIKTDGRDELPGEISVTPENKVKDVKGCSVAVTVNDKLDTGVWEFKGGLGRKHPKGFAGPDLSNTEETIGKKLDLCRSKVAFFSGYHEYEWQHAYNLGALLKKINQTKKRLDAIVLLADEPVAGREIKLRK